MATINVDPRQFGAVFKVKEHLRAEHVADAVHEAALLGAEVVAQAAPVDVGSLKASIRARRTGPRSSEIISDAPHAGIVEGGSRPHTPPLGPLIDWVRRHQASFAATPARRGRPRRRRRGGAPARTLSDAAITRIARAIQRKIALRGTAPRWFMRAQLPRLRKILAVVIRRRIRGPT